MLIAVGAASVTLYPNTEVQIPAIPKRFKLDTLLGGSVKMPRRRRKEITTLFEFLSRTGN